MDLADTLYFPGRGRLSTGGQSFTATPSSGVIPRRSCSPVTICRRSCDSTRIAWTLLEPSRPAVWLLDRLPGWRRLYADEVAVVHVRDNAATIGETSNAQSSEPLR